MSLHELFEPAQLGEFALKNRIVMAPMTRSRARADGVPSPEMADYYAQRASAGLIVTEGVQPSAEGQGYCRTPGVHTEAQIEAWRSIADGVREAGGAMAMQLMHVGRVASRHNKEAGARTLAPSAIAAKGEIYTDAVGMAPHETPEAMSAEDIARTIEDYAQAAANAVRAGMAGVELHATSGYLPAQFLSTGTNRRTDAYGGSLTGRLRFTVETLEAIAARIGPARVGIRVCPGNPFNDLSDENPEETFAALFEAIAPMGLAYLHVIRMPATGVDGPALARARFGPDLILNDSYSAEEAARAIEDGHCRAVSFARAFIANPDLPRRFREGLELARFDKAKLYTPGPEGYSDYPPAP